MITQQTVAFFFIIITIVTGSLGQPTWLVVRTDGQVEMRTDEAPQTLAHPPAPQSIPVFTELPDGSFTQGVTYQGASRSGYHAFQYPGAVTQKPDGTWHVESFIWSVCHGPRGRLLERKVAGSDYAMVITDQQVQHAAAEPRGGGIVWTYNHSGAPNNLKNSEDRVRRSIARAIGVYEELFKDDAISASFEFEWSSQGPGVLAFAETVQSAQAYSFIRTSIENTYAANSADTDTFENALYANLPSGSSIAYARPGNANDSTNAIQIVWPLRTKFTGIGFGSSLRIIMNGDLETFDPDPSTDISPIHDDLTGTLVHELGHHFGFLSNVEVLNFILEDSITVWDIFRLGANLGAVSPNQFFSSRRELRQTMEANGVTAINQAAWALPLSRGTTFGGDGFQSSHWKDDTINSGIYIGLMEAQSNGGSDIREGSYLQPSDIRAFDVMGYAINFSGLSPIPEPQLQSPTNDELVDPQLPLDFEWIPGAGSTTSDLLVYDLGSLIENQAERGGSPVLVYRADDVSGGSLVIPTTELQLLPGHRYQWHVAVYNPMGVRLADSETFFVACVADWNGDGIVNFFDMSAFLNAYNAQDPATDLASPFGEINFFDLSAFIALYNAGCP